MEGEGGPLGPGRKAGALPFPSEERKALRVLGESGPLGLERRLPGGRRAGLPRTQGHRGIRGGRGRPVERIGAVTMLKRRWALACAVVLWALGAPAAEKSES